MTDIKTPEEIAEALVTERHYGDKTEQGIQWMKTLVINTLTARDAALEKTLREKVNDIRAAFEGTTPSDTDRAYLAALIDFDAIITATLSTTTHD